MAFTALPKTIPQISVAGAGNGTVSQTVPLVVLTININSSLMSGGWQEQHCVGFLPYSTVASLAVPGATSTATQKQAAGAALAAWKPNYDLFSMLCWRAALLGYPDQIVNARLTITGANRISFPVLTNPIPALAVAGIDSGASPANPVNLSRDQISLRLMTASGNAINHGFRGVRDTEVVADQWATTGVLPLLKANGVAAQATTNSIAPATGLATAWPQTFKDASSTGGATGDAVIVPGAQFYFNDPGLYTNSTAGGAASFNTSPVVPMSLVNVWTNYLSILQFNTLFARKYKQATNITTGNIDGFYFVSPWSAGTDYTGASYQGPATANLTSGTAQSIPVKFVSAARARRIGRPYGIARGRALSYSSGR